MNLSEFLHMGGYAGYVWSAFGLTAFILIANVVAARLRLTRLLRATRRRLSVQEVRS